MSSAEQNQKMETSSIPQAVQNVEEVTKFKYSNDMMGTTLAVVR